ncbi:MAG: class I SAM-dependent methyltransferase [Phenylobacterium sp.]
MAETGSDWSRLAGRGRYPVSQAHWLLNPLRRWIAPPGRTADRLDLAPGMKILEAGCGPGWFSPELAARLSGGGLTLLDAQAGMIDLARGRLRRAGAVSFNAVLGLVERLPFDDAAFDRVLMVTVLGEVPDPAAGMSEVARVLKPGGALCLVEAAGDPDRLSRAEADALASAAGLVPERAWKDLLTETLLYRRPPAGVSPPASA